MKSTIIFISGLAVCLVLAGYYGYLVYSNTLGLPKVSVASDSSQLDPSVFTKKIFTDIETKNANGPLPIQLNASDLGNSQPF